MGAKRPVFKSGPCLLCGDHLSQKNVLAGDAVAIFDAIEGQLGIICLYHCTRRNPTYPAKIGQALMDAVEHLVPIRHNYHGRSDWADKVKDSSQEGESRNGSH